MSDLHNIKSGINPDFSWTAKKMKDLTYYQHGIVDGDRFILSEIITLLESQNETKRDWANRIISGLPAVAKSTIRIGITGSPGVGKSTFIETMGLSLISRGHKVAVLAIDPSSQLNKGSILGDKTRMQMLASHHEAYVRPTPSGSVLGGTAAFTKDCIHLCEAAGFDMVIVETVGVGQSETEVDNITDVNLLLLQPGAGDDIQGIKRGIIENADIFIINKADGVQAELAKQTKTFYQNAIHLFHHDTHGWICPVILTSALENKGIDTVYDAVLDYVNILSSNGRLDEKRKLQELKWFERQTIIRLQQIAFSHKKVTATFRALSDDIIQQRTTTTTALHEMEKTFLSILKN